MMFRYCHYVNARVTSVTDASRNRLANIDKPLVVARGKSHTITLGISYPPGREKTQFFLVVANNCSKFETYRISVMLQEPVLRVEPTLNSFELESGFTEDIWRKRKATELPILLNRADYCE
jgi:regulation of enolase protein 1 (concanavalin A-like superfamily)